MIIFKLMVGDRKKIKVLDFDFMKLKEFMQKHYTDLPLTPELYHQWIMGIHLILGNNFYQFDDNSLLNMKMFNKVYKQVSAIIPIIFKKTDDVFVVVNSYPHVKSKTVYPNFFKRYVKEPKLKYSLSFQEFQWQFDEEILFVQQMTLPCKVSDLRLEPLLKTLIHEDFSPLRPRLRKAHCHYAPDIFLINIRTKCIFHLYDDRGCEIINPDKHLHDKLVQKFSGWVIVENS